MKALINKYFYEIYTDKKNWTPTGLIMLGDDEF